MVIREENTGFICADLRADALSFPTGLGASYTVDPVIQKVDDIDSLEKVTIFAMNKKRAGFLIVRLASEKVVGSVPYVSPNFELYVFSEFAVCFYDPSITLSRVYKAPNAGILSSFELFTPVKAFLSEFALMSGTLPSTFVSTAKGNYYFYDNSAKADAAGLFKADRLAWKDKQLVYAEHVDMSSYTTRMVPTTLKGLRSQFVFAGMLKADTTNVVLKPSAAARAAAQGCLTTLAAGAPFTAQEREDIKKYMKDFSGSEPKADELSLHFDYPIWFKYRDDVDKAIIDKVVFFWEKMNGLTKFINTGDYSDCTAIHYVSDELAAADAKRIRDLEALKREMENMLNGHFQTWKDAVNRNIDTLNAKLESGSIDPVLKYTSGATTELICDSGDYAFKLDLSQLALKFAKMTDDPDFVVDVNTGNNNSVKFYDKLLSQGMLLGVTDGEGELAESPELLTEDCANAYAAHIKSIVIDRVKKQAEKVFNAINDASRSQGPEMSFSITSSAGGESHTNARAYIFKKHLTWFCKTYWSADAWSSIVWPFSGDTDKPAKVCAAEYGRYVEGLNHGHNHDNWKVRRTDGRPVDFDLFGVRVDGHKRFARLRVHFPLSLNAAPFIHCQLGQQASTANSKAWMDDIVASIQAKVGGQTYAQFRDLEQKTYGVTTEATSYGPGFVPWEKRDDWIMNLSFTRKDDTTGTDMGFNSAYPSNVTFNGEHAKGGIMATRASNFDVTVETGEFELLTDDDIFVNRSYSKTIAGQVYNISRREIRGCFKKTKDGITYDPNMQPSDKVFVAYRNKVKDLTIERAIEIYYEYYSTVINICEAESPVIVAQDENGDSFHPTAAEYLGQNTNASQTAELGEKRNAALEALEKLRTLINEYVAEYAKDINGIEPDTERRGQTSFMAIKNMTELQKSRILAMIDEFARSVATARSLPDFNLFSERQLDDVTEGKVLIELIGAYATC